MRPRKNPENKVNERELIDFNGLVNIFHQKADVVQREQIISFLRNLIHQYLSNFGVDEENGAKYKISMVSRNSFAIIFNIISSEPKHDNLGTMFFEGIRMKGLPKDMKQKPKSIEEFRKIPLVEKINIKLAEIDPPKTRRHKIHPKKVRAIVESPDATFNVEI
jgi:hypothetical protein